MFIWVSVGPLGKTCSSGAREIGRLRVGQKMLMSVFIPRTEVALST